MPRPVEALPCGSRSMISTRSPTAASAVPRLMAVVVLPTPPFWLAMARTRGPEAGADDFTDWSGTTIGGSDMRPRFALEHDPEKLQTFRTKIMLKIKHLRALSDST